MHGEEVAIASDRTFMLSNDLGDIEPGTRQGVFLGDTRFLSRLQTTVDGAPLVAIGGAYQDECFPCETLIRWSRRGRCEPRACEFDIELAPRAAWHCRMTVEFRRNEAEDAMATASSAV